MSGRWGASRFGRQGSRPGWCQLHEAKLDPAPLRPSEDTSSRRGPAGTRRASPTPPQRRRRSPQPRPSCSRGKRRHNLLKSLPVDINFRAQLGKVRPNALTNKKTTKKRICQRQRQLHGQSLSFARSETRQRPQINFDGLFCKILKVSFFHLKPRL